MTDKYHFIEQLDKSPQQWELKVYVQRVWNVSTTRGQTLDFILMDEKGAQIHGFIAQILSSKFENFLKEGNIIYLKNFTIIEKMKKYYCPLKYQYNLEIRGDSTVEFISERIQFPKPCFEFIEFNNIRERLNDDSYLTDVVGIFVQLKDEITVGTKGSKKQELFIENSSGTPIKITFWNDAIKKIPTGLTNYNNRPILVVTSTTVRENDYDGTFLNNTFATKIYVNLDIPEVDTLKNCVSRPPPVLYSMRKSPIDSDKLKTIADIYKFLSDGVKGFYYCEATISNVHINESWYYNSCEKCRSSIYLRESTYWCKICKNEMANPTMRYRVQFEIEDDSGRINITGFEEVAEYLLGKNIDMMVDLNLKENGDNLVKEELLKIVGRRETFGIRIGNYNLENPNRALTASTINPFCSKEKKTVMA